MWEKVRFQTFFALAPAPEIAPECFKCGRPSDQFVTKTSNCDDNASRPYFRDVPCDEFLVFNDSRVGVYLDIPVGSDGLLLAVRKSQRLGKYTRDAAEK